MMGRDLLILLCLTAALLGWLGLKLREPLPDTGRIGLADVLGPAPESFRQVTGPLPLHFPDDHAAHPDYRSEWWYFTGTLDGSNGERLGFQFTLFRFGLDPAEQRPLSAWAADALWMAHLALSDADGRRFFQSERFARGALGLAGASAERWWLRDWSVEALASGWQLRADAGEFALDLQLDLTRPLVLQGDQGYSRKGEPSGAASRYYSATRLAASGAVAIDGRSVPVSGLAWLDREWGSGQLPPDVVGWDWFALHLDDGRDLMVYRLRDRAGQATPFSAGALVASDGESSILAADDFTTEPGGWWRDEDGQRWPLRWRLELPGQDLALDVVAVFDDQLWRQSVSYWEGMVDVFEAGSDRRLGRGYMELSGYSGGNDARGR